MAELTFDRAAELLSYDPVSGALTWRLKRNGRGGGVNPGDVAGSPFKGYLTVGVDRKRFLAHRLAWLLHFGCWPEGSIDHIDGDGTNNRITNLRDVSHAANLQNRKAATAGNKSTGLLGAYALRNTGRFVACYHPKGKKVHLGVFPTAEEAHAAHLAARREHYEGNTL